LPLQDECDESKRDRLGGEREIEASIPKSVDLRPINESEIMSKYAEHGVKLTDYAAEGDGSVTEVYLIAADIVEALAPEQTDILNLETASSEVIVDVVSIEDTAVLSTDTVRKAIEPESDKNISEIIPLPDECFEKELYPAELLGEMEASVSQSVLERYVDESTTKSESAEHGAIYSDYTAEGETSVAEAYSISAEIVETHALDEPGLLNREIVIEEGLMEGVLIEDTEVLSKDTVRKAFELESDTCICEILPLPDECDESKRDHMGVERENEASIAKSVDLQPINESEIVLKYAEHEAKYTDYSAEGEASVTEAYLISADIVEALAPEQTDILNLETAPGEVLADVVSLEGPLVLSTDTVSKAFEPESDKNITEIIALADECYEMKLYPAELVGEMETSVSQSVLERHIDESEIKSKSAEHGAIYSDFTVAGEPSVTEVYLVSAQIVEALAPDGTGSLKLETAADEGVVEGVFVEDTEVFSKDTFSKSFEPECDTCIPENLPLQDEYDRRKSLSKSVEHGAEYTVYTSGGETSVTEAYLIAREGVETLVPEETDRLNLERSAKEGVVEMVLVEDTEVLSKEAVSKAFETESDTCASDILALEYKCDESGRDPSEVQGEIKSSIAHSVVGRNDDESESMSKSSEHGAECNDYTEDIIPFLTEVRLIVPEVVEALATKETDTLNLESAAEECREEVLLVEDVKLLSKDRVRKSFETEPETCITEILPLHDEYDESKRDLAGLRIEIEYSITPSIFEGHIDASERVSKSAEHEPEYIDYTVEGEPSVTDGYLIAGEIVEALAPAGTDSLNQETAVEEGVLEVVSIVDAEVFSKDTVIKSSDSKCDACISEILPLRLECDERKRDLAGLKREIEASIAQSVVERHIDEIESVSKSAEYGSEYTDYTAERELSVTEADLITAEIVEVLAPDETHTLNLESTRAEDVEIVPIDDTVVLSTDIVSKSFETESDTRISENLPLQNECHEMKPVPPELQGEIEDSFAQRVVEQDINESELMSKCAEHGNEYTHYTAERGQSVKETFLISAEIVEALAPDETDTLKLETAAHEVIVELVSLEDSLVSSKDTVSKTFESESHKNISETMLLQDECKEKEHGPAGLQEPIEAPIVQSIVGRHIDECESMSKSAERGTGYTDYTAQGEPSVREAYLIPAEILEALEPDESHKLNLETTAEECVVEVVLFEDTEVFPKDTISKSFEPESDICGSEILPLQVESYERKLDVAVLQREIEATVSKIVVDHRNDDSESMSKYAEHGAECTDYTAESYPSVTEPYLIPADIVEVLAAEETFTLKLKSTPAEGVVEDVSLKGTVVLSSDTVSKVFEPESVTYISKISPFQDECNEKDRYPADLQGEIESSIAQSVVEGHLHESESKSKSAEHGAEYTDYTAVGEPCVTDAYSIAVQVVEARAPDVTDTINLETANAQYVVEMMSLEDTEVSSTDTFNKAFEPESGRDISESIPLQAECYEKELDPAGLEGEKEASISQSVLERHIDESESKSKSAEHGPKYTAYTVEGEPSVTEAYLISTEIIEALAPDETGTLNLETPAEEDVVEGVLVVDTEVLLNDTISKAFEREPDTCINYILALQDGCSEMESDPARLQLEVEASIVHSVVERDADEIESMSKSAEHGPESTDYSADRKQSVTDAYLIDAEIVERLSTDLTHMLNLETAAEEGVLEVVSLEDAEVLSKDYVSKEIETESDACICEILALQDECEERKRDPAGLQGEVEASIAQSVVERHIDGLESISKSTDLGAEHTDYTAEEEPSVTEAYLVTAEIAEGLAREESVSLNLGTAADDDVLKVVPFDDTLVLSTDAVCKAFEPESDTCICSESLPLQDECDEKKCDSGGLEADVEASIAQIIVEGHIDGSKILSKSVEHGFHYTSYTSEGEPSVTEASLIAAEIVVAFALDETDALILENGAGEAVVETMSLEVAEVLSKDTVRTAFAPESGTCSSEILPLRDESDEDKRDPAGLHGEVEGSIAQSVVEPQIGGGEIMSRSAVHEADYTDYTAVGEPSVKEDFLVASEFDEALAPEETLSLNVETTADEGVVEVVLIEDTEDLSKDTVSKEFEPESYTFISENLNFQDGCDEGKRDHAALRREIEASISQSVVDRYIDEREIISKSAEHGAHYTNYNAEGEPSVTQSYFVTADNMKAIVPEESCIPKLKTGPAEDIVEVVPVVNAVILSTDIVSKTSEPESDTCISEILPFQDECDESERYRAELHRVIETTIPRNVVRHIDESESVLKSADHRVEYTDYTAEGEPFVTEAYLLAADIVETTDTLNVDYAAEEGVLEVVLDEDKEVLSQNTISKAFETESDAYISKTIHLQDEYDEKKCDLPVLEREIEAYIAQSVVEQHIDESESNSASAKHGSEYPDYTAEGESYVTEAYIFTAQITETLAPEENCSRNLETATADDVVEVVPLDHTVALSPNTVSMAFEPESDTCISEILFLKDECFERVRDPSGLQTGIEASNAQNVLRHTDESDIMSKSGEHGAECTNYPAEGETSGTKAYLIAAEIVEALAPEETDMLNMATEVEEGIVEVVSLEDTVVLSTDKVSKSLEQESHTSVSEIIPLQDESDEKKRDIMELQKEIEVFVTQSVVERHLDESESMSISGENVSGENLAEYTDYNVEGEPSVTEAYLVVAEIVEALAPEGIYTLNLETAADKGKEEVVSLDDTEVLSTESFSKAFEPETDVCISEILPLQDEFGAKKRYPPGLQIELEASNAQIVVERHIDETETVSKYSEHGTEFTDYTEEVEPSAIEAYIIPAEIEEALALGETASEECTVGLESLEDTVVLFTDAVSEAFETESDTCISVNLALQDDCDERKSDHAGLQGEIRGSIVQSVVERHIDEIESVSKSAEHESEYTDYTAEGEPCVTEAYLITAEIVEAFAPDEPDTLNPECTPAEDVEVVPIDDTVVLSTDIVRKSFEPKSDTYISEILRLQDECHGMEPDRAGLQGEIEDSFAQNVVEQHIHESESMSNYYENGAEYPGYTGEGEQFFTEAYLIPADIVEAAPPEETHTLNMETTAEKSVVEMVSLKDTVVLFTDTASKAFEPDSDTCESEILPLRNEWDEKKPQTSELQGDVEASITQSVVERRIDESESMSKSAEHGAEYTDYTAEGEASVTEAYLIPTVNLEVLAPELTDTLKLEKTAEQGIVEVVLVEDTEVLSKDTFSKAFETESHTGFSEVVTLQGECDERERDCAGLQGEVEASIAQSVVEWHINERESMSKSAEHGAEYTDYTAEGEPSVGGADLILAEIVETLAQEETDTLNLETAAEMGEEEVVSLEGLPLQEELSERQIQNTFVAPYTLDVLDKEFSAGVSEFYEIAQVSASVEVVNVDVCEDLGVIVGGSIKHEGHVQEIEIELEPDRVFVKSTKDIVPLDRDGIFQEKEATKLYVGKESVGDVSTRPYDDDYKRKLSKGEKVVRIQEHVLKTEIPHFLGNELEIKTDAVAIVDVRNLHAEEEALLDKDTADGISTDVTSVLEETLLQNDMKRELDSEECFVGHREQHLSDIFGKGVEFQEHSLRKTDVAEMSVFEEREREFRTCDSEVGGYCVIDGEASVSEEVVDHSTVTLVPEVQINTQECARKPHVIQETFNNVAGREFEVEFVEGFSEEEIMLPLVKQTTFENIGSKEFRNENTDVVAQIAEEENDIATVLEVCVESISSESRVNNSNDLRMLGVVQAIFQEEPTRTSSKDIVIDLTKEVAGQENVTDLEEIIPASLGDVRVKSLVKTSDSIGKPAYGVVKDTAILDVVEGTQDPARDEPTKVLTTESATNECALEIQPLAEDATVELNTQVLVSARELVAHEVSVGGSLLGDAESVLGDSETRVQMLVAAHTAQKELLVAEAKAFHLAEDVLEEDVINNTLVSKEISVERKYAGPLCSIKEESRVLEICEIIATGEKVTGETGVKKELCVGMPTVGSNATDVPFLYHEDKDNNQVPADESEIFKTEDSFVSYVVAEVETNGRIDAEGNQGREVDEDIGKFHVNRHVEGFEEDVFKDETRERLVGICCEEEEEEEASSSSKEFEPKLNAAGRKAADREAASIKPPIQVEVEKCDLGEEVCEAGLICRITQETEAEVNRTEGKATKFLLAGQEYCDLEALEGVKDLSAVLSQQDLMAEKSKVETEVVETTECADSEACIGLSSSSESKSDSSLVTTVHQIRLPRDSQSVTDRLSASYLVQEGSHYFVPCRDKDEEEISSKPEVQKTIVDLESQFIEGTSREDFDDAKIGDSAEETGSSKSESRIFDDTQTNLLPSEAVVPFLSSSNVPQFSKICDTNEGKIRVTRKPLQQRLVIDTNVAETEVKELICEVREVTRQIKQEVREMKPDLTPTPEGKESSILPISDSREFVELTDLGCIKEEQIVLDLGDEIIKHPDSFFAIDASSGTASCAALSGTETGWVGSCPRSRGNLLQAKASRPAVDSEASDTLSEPSSTVPIGWTSQEVQKTLSASVCRLTGRNINNALGAPDTIVETSARRMPEQDREVDFMPDTSIIEEVLRTVSNTLTDLGELTTSETPDEKGEILNKSSGSLFENVTESEVVLDLVAPASPVGIVATSVSAEVSDKLRKPLYEIERGCRRDDAPAIMPDVEKHIIEESITEITSRCEEGLFVQETAPSDVAEAESVVIELTAERELQETEQLSQDPELSLAVEGKYISHVSFEDRRRLQEMEPSAAVEEVTPVISDVILEDGMSVSKKFESSVYIVPADFIEVSQPASRLQSGVSSLPEQYLYSSRENAEIPTETSNWEINSHSGFQVSKDDIVMEDDLLEVTVTTEKSSDFGSEGKLFTTETGTTYFEFESGTTRSICVCEKVISSQPVTLHAPGLSVSHHAEKVAQDTTQDESSVQKSSLTSKSKTRRSEKLLQSDSTSLKSRRDPKPIATMKKLDDNVTALRSPKETDKFSQVTHVPSDGTVHRYRGYMASTLSRDLKVERTVAERTSYISRDSPVKRRVITEREDSSSTTSPSKLSTGGVPKPPQTVTKSKRVENTSTSSERNVQETTKHSYVSKHTKSTTSAVTVRPVVATEEKLIANVTNAGSSSNTAVHQKRPVARDLPSSSSVRQARISSTFKKSLPESDISQECGGKIKRSEQSKVWSTVKEQRKLPPVRGKGRKIIEAVPDTTLKVTAKKRAPKLESRIEIDREDILKATDSTEVTKTDCTAVMPASSPAGILTPAEQDMTTPHSHVTDLKETATAHTFPLLSHVPSPDSSPSIKSILDKWSAVASERRSSRAPSPSPSASPVRAATSASRSTERVDFSTHTPSSLPSSPSRMVRQTTSQSGVTQILTSEVFTRTVDTSGSIEVIYRQPTSSEAVRRVAVVGGSRSSLHETVPGYGGTGTEGEVSLIDTTDSSLSDSVALPSSSSDHELSMEMRLRTGVSPASPKPTSRSLDLIHDVMGPKLPTSDFALDYCAVPFVADSEHLAPDSSVLRLEGSSATVPLDAVPKTRTCTQVSEERLSPILDVCAVTPPRVKHKFQYEEDEEGEEDEAVAAFLSSPGNTDDLPSAPTFHSTLAAAASVQSMASELDLRFCEVHMNVGSDSHWDSESGKPSLDNLLSKTSYSKQFVNCERFEGKFGTGCNRYDEVYGVEFNVPKSQVIPYSSEGKPGILSDLQLAAMYMSVQSDPQIIWDQFSETGSFVEDSIPIKEVVYKQEPQTRGVAKFNLATDLSVNLLNEDEDILDMGEEDIHTLSTSGSEVDYAVVESSSNPLAMIEEEAAEATDEDQDVIPVDDIPVKMGNLDPGEINRHCRITSQSDCMSEQPPVFLNSVNNMAFNHDSLPLLAAMPDDGSNSDVLIRRPYKSVPVVSVDDGYVHLECSEMCDGDDGDIISCPETSTPFGNMLHFPDTTAGHADFKESSKSSLMLCKDFVDPGTRFLSGCSTETWSPPDIKESVTSTDKNIHFSESCKLGTTKSLADFVCDGLLSHIPPASKMGRKHSQPPPPSVPSLSNRPNVVYLSDSDEEEQNKQRHPCIMALGGRHSRVSTITTVEIHQLFGNEDNMYNFATGKDLPDFVDYHSSASLVCCESHEGQGIFHSELDGFFSVDGSKSSHPPPINIPQNKFVVGIGVPELFLNSQTDTENVEVTEDIRNSREQSTGGAKSLIKSPLKEVQYFCGTVCMVHESKPKGMNCEPCYMTRKTYSDMVELESDCTNKAPYIRGKDLPLQKTPSSEDNTAEDNVEDSDMILRCYTNSSERKTETSETEFVDVNDEACLMVGPSGKILSMNTVSASDENVDTCAQDMQVSERKPSLFTRDNDGRTVADFEGFKIEIHEKTPKLSHVISSVRDNFHKSLVHISVLELDTRSHTLPYEDGSGLCATDTDLSTGSGVQTESDKRQTYTELPIIDGSIIETSGITRDLRKYKYAFKVCSSPGPDTNTEDHCFHGAVSDRHGKSNGDLRLISVKGDKPLITDVKNLEVSESQYSTKHMPAPIFASRKHDDANTGIEYVDMSEEDTSIPHNFVRHVDYNAVASMKETDDGPFLADMLQVLPITSLAVSVIKVTSSSPDMYSGIETEIVDVESADGGALLGSSCIETSAPVEMGLGTEGHNVSTTHMKSTHGSDMCAPQNMDHVRGCGDICEVVTDVEELGLTEKESPQDQPDDNIHVIDAEDQVCVCVSSEKETQNAVCVCMGKCHGQLSMEWRTSSGSSASKTSSWNATQGHEGMICLLDLSSAAASLPLSCIRADLPPMQVAVPYYNVESVGSNPLA